MISLYRSTVSSVSGLQQRAHQVRIFCRLVSPTCMNISALHCGEYLRFMPCLRRWVSASRKVNQKNCTSYIVASEKMVHWQVTAFFDIVTTDLFCCRSGSFPAVWCVPSNSLNNMKLLTGPSQRNSGYTVWVRQKKMFEWWFLLSCPFTSNSIHKFILFLCLKLVIFVSCPLELHFRHVEYHVFVLSLVLPQAMIATDRSQLKLHNVLYQQGNLLHKIEETRSTP